MNFPKSRISGQINKIRREKLKSETAASVKPIVSDYALPLGKTEAESLVSQFFNKNSWEPLEFQKTAWKSYDKGHHLLINVPTGSGKTYAAYMAPLVEILTEAKQSGGYRLLYLSPLRSLVRDIQRALQNVSNTLRIPVQIDVHTGDSKINTKSKKSLGQVLVTTPESFALLMANQEKDFFFKNLKTLIVDEAHEIFSSKRGSLLELDLAHLRTFAKFRNIVVSATVANGADLARRVDPAAKFANISALHKRKVHIDILPNHTANRLAFFGFMGTYFIEQILSRLNLNASQILFANTRAQAEAWFRRLREASSTLDISIELHHGSLDREERHRVETALKNGTVDLLVATSSLELGVDFPEIEHIFQIGSPKSVARTIQRAGRGFHKPELESHLTIVPTSIFDFVECQALNTLLKIGRVENISSPEFPVDVLLQYLQTRALRDGFDADQIFKEIQSTVAFRDITPSQFESYIHFLLRGSPALVAYPHFLKLHKVDGKIQFIERSQQRRHLLNMGTIVDNVGIRVKYLTGGYVGSLDEAFVSRLKKGDLFSFAGRVLQYVSLRDLVLNVRLAKGDPKHVAAWQGSHLSLSSFLSHEMLEVLHQVALEEQILDPSIAPVFELQRSVSAIPLRTQLLVEQLKTREGFHMFIYTFEGRAANEGIGHLLAYRLAKMEANTFTVSCNDFGIELIAKNSFPTPHHLTAAFASGLENLQRDIALTFNYPEIAKRKFREVARISGLVQPRQFSGAKTDRQVQVSTSLLFDVLKSYDPKNILIQQSEIEVLNKNLDLQRLHAAFVRFEQQELLLRSITRLSPFAFPLYVERVRSTVSTETLETRISRILKQSETSP